MPAPWNNADGLSVKLAQYYKDPKNFVNRLRTRSVVGEYNEVAMDIDLTQIPTGTTSYTSDLNNDGTLDGFNLGDVCLPQNSSVIAVRLYTVIPAAGGTSFTVGTYGLTGSAIAATGLVTATEGVLANFDTIGKRTIGAGALVSTSAGTAGVGTADAFVGVTTSGTFTAGKIRMVITYFDPIGPIKNLG